MRIRDLIQTVAAAAFSQGVLFLLQTYLVFTHRFSEVISLGKYSGLFSLIFFLCDGNSGLVFGVVRRNHGVEAAHAGFLIYRMLSFSAAVVAMFVYAFVSPHDATWVVPTVLLSLALRAPWIDGYLDASGRLALAVVLSNFWTLCVCIAAIALQRVDAMVVGIGAVAGSAVMALARLALRGRGAGGGQSVSFSRPALAASGEIFRFMGLYGYGQIYGRLTVFAMGAFFAGPAAALALHGKQVFNISGLVVSYIRRLEVSSTATASASSEKWNVREMLFSGVSQLLTAAGGAVVVFIAGATSHMLLFALLIALWQTFEKISGNCVYAFQLMNKHALGYGSLIFVSCMGAIGIFTGRLFHNVNIYLLAETAAFCIILCFWAATYLSYRRQEPALAEG